jgi:F-type H+-transporting ATPase subunit a
VVSNWIGLLPGIGSIGRYLVMHGEVELVPVFRPANTDLNLTIAMALTVVLVSHFLGIAVIGFFKYANKFIKLGDLYHAIKSLKPMNIMTAVIEFFVGILEIISEVAKLLSFVFEVIWQYFCR